jgi:arylformamidase
MLIDITRTIGLDTLTYPGDAPPAVQRTDDMARGAAFNGTYLSLSAHCGTHLDAPLHFLPDGAAIADLPLERFWLPALVVDTGPARVITAELAEALEFAPGEAVLFKTANALLPRDRYSMKFVYLDAGAAQVLASRGAGLVGIDYLSVDKAVPRGTPIEQAFISHSILMRAGVLILEEADLRQVQPGRYRLYCFPLRLHATEASPVRAVLEQS